MSINLIVWGQGLLLTDETLVHPQIQFLWSTSCPQFQFQEKSNEAKGRYCWILLVCFFSASIDCGSFLPQNILYLTIFFRILLVMWCSFEHCSFRLHAFPLLTQTLPGTVVMLKGSVLRFSFLDCMGALIQSPHEVWRDPNAPEDPDRVRRRKLIHFSSSSSQEGEGHLAVVCSERQAKVVLMPSQSCLYVHNITESSFVLRADVVSVSNSVCLACFCANGHVMTLRYYLKYSSTWNLTISREKHDKLSSQSWCIVPADILSQIRADHWGNS